MTTSLWTESSLQLVQSSFAKRYIVNAMLAQARAVTVEIVICIKFRRITIHQSQTRLQKDLQVELLLGSVHPESLH